MNFQLDEDLVVQVRNGAPWAYRSWEPDHAVIVLGRGNKTALEVYESRCQSDEIPIMRRRGGGGTVVLAPGTLVISLVKHVRQQFGIKEYFGQINTHLIEALHHLGVRNLHQQGHSDICIRDRKILGSSMYRSKSLLFYTASLMVSNNLELINRYLKHPSKEPDYRRGRPHQNFLTTLQQEYPEVTVEKIKTQMDEYLPICISKIE